MDDSTDYCMHYDGQALSEFNLVDENIAEFDLGYKDIIGGKSVTKTLPSFA